MKSLMMSLLLTVAVSPSKSSITYVDLAHVQNNETLQSVPGPRGFNLTNVFRGFLTPNDYFEFNTIQAAEHSGTHLDVPSHIIPGAKSLEEIPLKNFIAEGVVIDCRSEAAADRNYGVTVEKIQDWESRYGRIPQKAAVLFNFGWDLRYGDENDFKGTDNQADLFSYRFPFVTFAAYQYLQTNFEIKIVGTDAASPDPYTTTGPNGDFPIHKDLLGREGIIVEQLRDLQVLPPRGFVFYATPVKYDGATGTQVRAFAMVRSSRRFYYYGGKR